jgi:hypothetical protein
MVAISPCLRSTSGRSYQNREHPNGSLASLEALQIGHGEKEAIV